ncbi:tetratricopeptide repeat protein [Candidatus Latescibacterota bacterium]
MIRTAQIWIIVVICIVCAAHADAQNGYDVPRKAIELIGQGKFEEAKVELNTFQRKQPGNPLVLFYLGEIESDHNKALWYFKEVEILADSVLASEALFRRAEIVFSRENLAEAKDLFVRLTEIYPESAFCADAYYRLGLITLSGGAPGDAMNYFNRCIEQDSAERLRLFAVTGLMECYVAAGDWENARESALSVIGEKDDYSSVTPRALEVIALSWRKSGNEKNANEFTGRLLKNYPNSYQAYAIRQEGKAIAEDSSFSYDSNIIFTAPERPAESTPTIETPSENAKFSVQVGAYKERARALKVLRLLKDKGFDARVGMKTVQDTHYFAVQVGYYMIRKEADLMIKRITRDTGLDAIVYILD